MVRNLIVQYYDPYIKEGEYLKEQDGRMPGWMYIGMQSAQQYAKKIGAEYVFLRGKELMNFGNPFLSGMTIVFDDEFDMFDNILLIDADMIIQTEEDIFKEAVDGKCAMVHQWNDPNLTRRAYETPYANALKALFNKTPPKATGFPEFPGINLSGGLQLWSRAARVRARKDWMHPSQWWQQVRKTEQPYLNCMLIGFDMYHEMDPSWNVPPTCLGVTEDQKILHYGGKARKYGMYDYIEGKPVVPITVPNQ